MDDEQEWELNEPEHVQKFDRILLRNNEGIEPINSWETIDLLRMADCLDIELQQRGFAPMVHPEGSVDND